MTGGGRAEEFLDRTRGYILYVERVRGVPTSCLFLKDFFEGGTIFLFFGGGEQDRGQRKRKRT
jgi:hypothetical protein